MSKMEKAIRHNGEPIELNIEACNQFGCQHGDQIKVNHIEKAVTVVGVAPLPNNETSPCTSANQDLLWVRLDGKEYVSFLPNPEGTFYKV